MEVCFPQAKPYCCLLGAPLCGNGNTMATSSATSLCGAWSGAEDSCPQSWFSLFCDLRAHHGDI